MEWQVKVINAEGGCFELQAGVFRRIVTNKHTVRTA
jgi:hypothetical protein